MGELIDTITGFWKTHLQIQILGPTIAEYIGAFFCILGAYIANKIAATLLRRKFRALAERTRSTVDDALIDAVEKPVLVFIFVAGFFFAINLLSLSQKVNDYALLALKTASIVIATWLIIRLVDALSAYLRDLTKHTETRLDDQLVPLFTKAAKAFVLVVGLLVALQNLHVNVTGLIAGVSIAGAGIAFASQDTLANIFGAVVILLDKPFRVGDWIVAGGEEGVVEEVGFWSTRIRTFAKTQITIPNRQLAGTAINNWSRMPIRRVKMTVGVSYEASAEQMEQIVHKIRDILRSDERISQEFFLVNFHEFGESSLDIFLYYFTVTTDWAEYLQIRQEINLAVMRAIEDLGLEIAYPTRTVYMRGDKPPIRIESADVERAEKRAGAVQQRSIPFDPPGPA